MDDKPEPEPTEPTELLLDRERPAADLGRFAVYADDGTFSHVEYRQELISAFD